MKALRLVTALSRHSWKNNSAAVWRSDDTVTRRRDFPSCFREICMYCTVMYGLIKKKKIIVIVTGFLADESYTATTNSSIHPVSY